MPRLPDATGVDQGFFMRERPYSGCGSSDSGYYYLGFLSGSRHRVFVVVVVELMAAGGRSSRRRSSPPTPLPSTFRPHMPSSYNPIYP